MSLYSDVDLIHEPDAHPKWQESFVLIFRDPATDLVGFLRLGAYVNEGTCQTHFGLATGDGLRFRRHRLAMPASDGERTRERARRTSSWAIPRGACVHVRGEERRRRSICVSTIFSRRRTGASPIRKAWRSPSMSAASITPKAPAASKAACVSASASSTSRTASAIATTPGVRAITTRF